MTTAQKEITFTHQKNGAITVTGIDPDALRSVLTAACLHCYENIDASTTDALFAEDEQTLARAKEGVEWFEHLLDLVKNIEHAFARCFYGATDATNFPEFSDHVKDKLRELKFAKAKAELAGREFAEAVAQEDDDTPDPSPYSLVTKAQNLMRHTVQSLSYAGGALLQHAKPYSNDHVGYSMDYPLEHVRKSANYLKEVEKALSEYDKIPKEAKNWDYNMKQALPWE